MNAAFLAFGALAAFALGFRFYSKYLSRSIFKLHELTGKTPAHQLRDGYDYVPAKKSVLFGHHYASIAGAAPIVGPAVAVIWGWVPALIWVVLGTIFMGAAHDFGALVVSMQHRGQSIGSVCREIVGPRSRALFLIVIFFLIWLVMAVFALVIANLFISFPESVLPVNFQIIVALTIGYWINKRGRSILLPSILAQIFLLGMIVLGSHFPLSLSSLVGEENQMMWWICLLMLYSFIASTLPVWLLLQPRDYINSHMLLLGLAGLILGLFVVSPQVVAPAINPAPVGAPPWFPFLFITIACGAVSGFHGLVSSGTTAKQVSRWEDARPIGYGGMLGEGLLALLAIMAVTAGFASGEDWHSHYSSWNAANGLNAKISAFVLGSGSFLQGIGIPLEIANTVMAVFVISFAATSLDTAARIQRYVVGEMGSIWSLPALRNRHIGGAVAVGSALLLMLAKGGGKGGLTLWPLFGVTNQMLAGLTLAMISVFLMKKKRNAAPYLIPMVFMMMMTSLGLYLNISHFIESRDWFLGSIAVTLFIVQFWILMESIAVIRKNRRT